MRDKFFVMLADDGSTMSLKAPKGVQGILVNSDPERFFVPKYVGHIGWVGVRLDLRTPPAWDEVEEMIMESYCLTAPKRLAAQVLRRGLNAQLAGWREVSAVSMDSL